MEAAYVYRLAAALGSELQRLSDDFGTAALAGLVPQVVRLLELLETLASDGAAGGLGELLLGASSDEEPAAAAAAERSRQVAEQRLAEARERERRLQSQLAQLEVEQQRALSRLAGGQAQEDGLGRQERELMLQLKEVVDHQRDKIRAQDHEIQRKARDTEALQEQLNRFMTMNENLRRKLAMVQAQLRSALERKGEVEALWEAERHGRVAEPARSSIPTEQEGDVGGAAVPSEHPPDQRTFSKEELQQILQERNELKTSLFLVEEELAYYQREEEEEEGEGWPIGSPGSDCTDGHLPESRIKSFFNQWYHRTSQPSPPESRPGTWEIINAEDVGPGEEQREETLPGGSSSPGPTSPLP
ncbi:rab-interacting lysosomal protein isoform X3 [Ahaetulla prasina]|uniref:rab-interacting lysosomal protein isoform X3 n=1 Tax=Ahaetulla prasina TaxID=499056 RepID=UPI002647E3A4|nr:rab-interacting lysosomal protein isoform X3 [Ahaetulla prasina]